jgi:acyl-coenzyme A thioesterase PaaI-like protein
VDTKTSPIQDYYPPEWGRCYGCGRLNEQGLHIQTRWDGDETVTLFEPKPYHSAMPGSVYGGLIASLIDCHSTATAARAAYAAEGRELGTDPPIRYVTASLHVDYLRPTPLGPVLEIRGRVKELKGRKVVVTSVLSADGVACARGEVVAVRLKDSAPDAGPA